MERPTHQVNSGTELPDFVIVSGAKKAKTVPELTTDCDSFHRVALNLLKRSKVSNSPGANWGANCQDLTVIHRNTIEQSQALTSRHLLRNTGKPVSWPLRETMTGHKCDWPRFSTSRRFCSKSGSLFCV
jgi:hypothetical protein